MGNIPVWMKQTERGIYLACIGHFFPKEERRGQIILLENTPEGPRRKELFSRLPRPCHIDVTDFNTDGKPDLLCTVVHDFNGDFHPDIALLTGQETEILGIYYSDRKGGFEPLHTIFQRPPTHGHTCMEGADFNQDGRLDLLVCNGDNGDYESPATPSASRNRNPCQTPTSGTASLSRRVRKAIGAPASGTASLSRRVRKAIGAPASGTASL